MTNLQRFSQFLIAKKENPDEMLWCNFTSSSRKVFSMVSFDDGKKSLKFESTFASCFHFHQYINAHYEWSFPRHSDINNIPFPSHIARDDVKRRNFLWFRKDNFFKFNVAGYRLIFQFQLRSWETRASVKVKLRWFTETSFLLFRFHLFVHAGFYSVSFSDFGDIAVELDGTVLRRV